MLSKLRGAVPVENLADTKPSVFVATFLYRLAYIAHRIGDAALRDELLIKGSTVIRKGGDWHFAMTLNETARMLDDLPSPHIMNSLAVMLEAAYQFKDYYQLTLAQTVSHFVKGLLLTSSDWKQDVASITDSLESVESIYAH
jgi:hypothetical protein